MLSRTSAIPQSYRNSLVGVNSKSFLTAVQVAVLISLSWAFVRSSRKTTLSSHCRTSAFRASSTIAVRKSASVLSFFSELDSAVARILSSLGTYL